MPKQGTFCPSLGGLGVLNQISQVAMAEDQMDKNFPLRVYFWSFPPRTVGWKSGSISNWSPTTRGERVPCNDSG